jgi:hypothetical protein
MEFASRSHSDVLHCNARALVKIYLQGIIMPHNAIALPGRPKNGTTSQIIAPSLSFSYFVSWLFSCSSFPSLPSSTPTSRLNQMRPHVWPCAFSSSELEELQLVAPALQQMSLNLSRGLKNLHWCRLPFASYLSLAPSSSEPTAQT